VGSRFGRVVLINVHRRQELDVPFCRQGHRHCDRQIRP
jgi:hypothetical protein